MIDTKTDTHRRRHRHYPKVKTCLGNDKWILYWCKCSLWLDAEPHLLTAANIRHTALMILVDTVMIDGYITALMYFNRLCLTKIYCENFLYCIRHFCLLIYISQYWWPHDLRVHRFDNNRISASILKCSVVTKYSAVCGTLLYLIHAEGFRWTEGVQTINYVTFLRRRVYVFTRVGFWVVLYQQQ